MFILNKFLATRYATKTSTTTPTKLSINFFMLSPLCTTSLKCVQFETQIFYIIPLILSLKNQQIPVYLYYERCTLAICKSTPFQIFTRFV